MTASALVPILTPHGHLLLAPDEDAPALAEPLQQRLTETFARGAGHGLLQLGASEVATALPDSSMELTLDGENLSAAEIKELLAGSDGLQLIRRRGVKIDRQKLGHMLDRCRDIERVAAAGGLPFSELAARPMLLYDGVILRSIQGAITIRTNSHGSRPKPALSLR